MDHDHKVSGKSERVTMGILGDLTWNDLLATDLLQKQVETKMYK